MKRPAAIIALTALSGMFAVGWLVGIEASGERPAPPVRHTTPGQGESVARQLALDANASVPVPATSRAIVEPATSEGLDQRPGHWIDHHIYVQLLDLEGQPWSGEIAGPGSGADELLPSSWERPPRVIALPVEEHTRAWRAPLDAPEVILGGAPDGNGRVRVRVWGYTAVELAVIGGDPELGYFDGVALTVDVPEAVSGGAIRARATLIPSDLGTVEITARAEVWAPDLQPTTTVTLGRSLSFPGGELRPNVRPPLVPGGFHVRGPTKLVVHRAGSRFPLLFLRDQTSPGPDQVQLSGQALPFIAVLPPGAFGITTWNASEPADTDGWRQEVFGGGRIESVAGAATRFGLALRVGATIAVRVREQVDDVEHVTFTMRYDDGRTRPVMYPIYDRVNNWTTYQALWGVNSSGRSQPLPPGQGTLVTTWVPGGAVTEERVVLRAGESITVQR